MNASTVAVTRTERILELMAAADSNGMGVREAIAATIREGEPRYALRAALFLAPSPIAVA